MIQRRLSDDGQISLLASYTLTFDSPISRTNTQFGDKFCTALSLSSKKSLFVLQRVMMCGEEEFFVVLFCDLCVCV
jgi:hypothetical protein